MSYHILSALHIAAALAALLTGGFVVGLGKGTRTHKVFGYSYVASMLALNFSALLIYRLFGKFGPFHFAAIISLATLLAGFVPVFLRRPSDRWLERHLSFMVWSYIGLLAAGASEAMVRIPASPFWWAVILSSLLIFAAGWYLLARHKPALLQEHGAQQAVPADRPRAARSAGG